MIVLTDQGLVDTDSMARIDLIDSRIVFRNNENWASLTSIAGILTMESEVAAKAAFDEIMKSTALYDCVCEGLPGQL